MSLKQNISTLIFLFRNVFIQKGVFLEQPSSDLDLLRIFQLHQNEENLTFKFKTLSLKIGTSYHMWGLVMPEKSRRDHPSQSCLLHQRMPRILPEFYIVLLVFFKCILSQTVLLCHKGDFRDMLT